MRHVAATITTAALLAATATAALAAPSVGVSLNRCQARIGVEVTKYQKKYLTQVGRCLNRIAKLELEQGVFLNAMTAATDAVVEACIDDVQKLYDGDPNSNSAMNRFTRAVAKACAPGATPAVTHTLDDIRQAPAPGQPGLGTADTSLFGASVEQVCAFRLPPSNGYPVSSIEPFAGLSDWTHCVLGYAARGSASTFYAAYPRSKDWLRPLGGLYNQVATKNNADPGNSRYATAKALLKELREHLVYFGDAN